MNVSTAGRLTRLGWVVVCGAMMWASGLAEAQQRYLDEVFDEVTRTNDIAYGESIDENGRPETLLLDLYEPTGDTESHRPVMIWIHGGGFVGGTRRNRNIVELCNRFAQRGYVTASISYRLRERGFTGDELPQVVRDATEDAKAAVRWFRRFADTYRVDSARIAVGGSSAGAITSLHTNYENYEGNSGNEGFSSATSAAVSISGAMVDVTVMEPGEPPFAAFHGTQDTTLPFGLILLVVDRADEVGVDYRFFPVDGAGHNLFPYYNSLVIPETARFLFDFVINDGETDCEAVRRFRVSCRDGKLKVRIKAPNLAGATLHVGVNGGSFPLPLDERGKGKLKLKNRSGPQVTSIMECPEFTETVDCG